MHPCLLIYLKANKLKLTQYVQFKSYYEVLLKCIWKICLNSPGSFAGLTVTSSSLHHFSHETVTVITAVTVMERRE